MPIHKHLFFIALLTLSPVAAAAGGKPSFSCKKATTAVEKAICSNDRLADYDGQLGRLWKNFSGISNDQTFNERLRRDQEAWLKNRDACQSDVVCIIKAYQQRLADFGQDKKTYLFAGQYEKAKIGTVTIYPTGSKTYLVYIQTADPEQGAWSCELTGIGTEEGKQVLRITVDADSFPVQLVNANTIDIKPTEQVFTVAQQHCGLNGDFSYSYRRVGN